MSRQRPVARTGPRALVLALLLAGCAAPSAAPGVPAEPAAPSSAAPAASAWPTASGSAARTSATAAVGPQNAHERWRRTLEGAVVPGPVVGVDGSVLAASNGGVLHALDPSTGADRWTFAGDGRYGSDLSTSPAVLPDGTILWPGPRGRLLALSPAGRLLWTEQLAGLVLSPAVVGDVAYVADSTGTLVALRLDPGPAHRRLWQVDLGGTSYSSPAVGPDGLVHVAHDRQAVAVRPDGTVAWRFDARDTIEVSAAVGPDGTAVIGTNGDDTYALRPDGSVAWRWDRGDWTYSSAVVARGRAYFGDHLGYLDVLDLASGAVLRRDLGIPKAQGRTSNGTGVWTAPVVDAAGNAYFGTAAGHVYGFADDGRRLFDADVGALVASYPALTADGTLLVGSSDGVLHAFG